MYRIYFVLRNISSFSQVISNYSLSSSYTKNFQNISNKKLCIKFSVLIFLITFNNLCVLSGSFQGMGAFHSEIKNKKVLVLLLMNEALLDSSTPLPFWVAFPKSMNQFQKIEKTSKPQHC